MIQRYETERNNVAMVAHPEGRFILYADAEEWVAEEIAERDHAISRLNNNLCDRRISLETALKLCKGKDEEIAKLQADNENMARLNDSFPEEIARLEDHIAALERELDRARTRPKEGK